MRRRFVACTAAALLLVLLSGPDVGAAGRREWNLSPTVAPNGTGEFNAVDARSSNDVWVVGDKANAEGQVRKPPLAEHWDGRRWRVTPISRGAGVLNDVVATSPEEAWAVGAGDNHGLIEHWDGSRWIAAESPSFRGSSFAGRGSLPHGR